MNTLRKRRIHAVLLGVLFLVLFYIILFVPKDAEELLMFGQIKLEDAKSYHIHMTMKENVTFSAKQLPALKQFGVKETEVPVRWEKDIYHTDEWEPEEQGVEPGNEPGDESEKEREAVTCECSYSFEGKEGGFRQGIFRVGEQEYLLRDELRSKTSSDDSLPDGEQENQFHDAWFEVPAEGETVPASLNSIDPVELLQVEHAKMRRVPGSFRMTVDSGNAVKTIEELLGITPEPGTKIVFTFDRLSHMLQTISGSVKAEGRTMEFSVQVEAGEDGANETLSQAEKAIRETPGQPEPKEDKYTLTNAELKEKKMRCYTAGKDFPAGTYTIAPTKGRGIVLGISGKDGSELFRYNYGYNYFRIDTVGMKEERKQKLAEGTRIFLSGKGMVLELTGAKE